MIHLSCYIYYYLLDLQKVHYFVIHSKQCMSMYVASYVYSSYYNLPNEITPALRPLILSPYIGPWLLQAARLHICQDRL